MVKIRLRRTGSKHRPFYRVVVAKSTSGRDGAFIEIIGTYNPVLQPKLINIKEDRALHWLMSGAQPSETAAIIMNRVGILEKYFEARPAARKQYKFLDKRTASMSVQSVVSAPAAEKSAPKAEAPAPSVDEPVAEAAPEIVETPVEEAPAASVEEVVEAPADDATVEAEAVAPEPEVTAVTDAAPAVEEVVVAEEAPAEVTPAEESK